jgi:3-oxoacyl-[acyl-carrier-protein] synthase-1
MDQDYIDHHEMGILYGNDSSAKAVIETNDIIRENKDTMLVGSGSVFQTMNSTVTMNLATIFKLRGINFTISAACASGSHSIGLGYHFIKTGLQECIMCGGAQEINKFSMGSLMRFQRFRSSSPPRQKLPVLSIATGTGSVPSGGAATVVLESLDSALKRGAPILGEIVGYGFSSNGSHISNPTVDGPVRSLQMALKDAGMQAKRYRLYQRACNLNSCWGFYGSESHSRGFWKQCPYVSSTKSMTGHECWMAVPAR